MLDLNELEKMLDDALNRESSESLTDWMMTRKAQSVSNFIGDTSGFTSMDATWSNFVSSSIEMKEKYSTNLDSSIFPDDDLLKAA